MIMEPALAEKTYTIQEVEAEMGVSAHTLRYYEKIGLLHAIRRRENGRRVYSEGDLGWIYWLKLLRESGMSIQMTKRYVEMTRAGDHTMEERCAILQEHRAQLREKIKRLEGYLERLDQKVEFYYGYKARQGPVRDGI
jgi:DNA-binding transcriptional MerR regulator